MTALSRNTEQTIGQPFTATTLTAYEWADTWPVVEVNPDGTVGRVETIVSADDVPPHLTGVTITEGRIVSAGGDFDVDAMASREELRAAGFAVDDAE